MKYTTESLQEMLNAKFGDRYTLLSEFEGVEKPITFKLKCKHGETIKVAKEARNLIRCSETSYCYKCYYNNNRYEFVDDYVIGYTNKNDVFYVSVEDYDKIKDITWCKNGSGYLTGNIGNNQIVLMHRYIMNCPDDMCVDHIGGRETKNDNRRNNLRLATPTQNNINTKIPKTNTSGYKGVYYRKDTEKWAAQISYGINEKNGKKKCYYLGSYETIEEAAEARRKAEIEIFGEFSPLN